MQEKKRSCLDLPIACADGAAQRIMYGSLLLSIVLVSSANAAPVTSDITALLRDGKQVEAMLLLDARLKKDPQNAQLRFTKGVVLIEQKRTQEAIAIFLKLSEEYPNLPEPYNNLAVLYSQDNQYEKARAALGMAIRTSSSYATAYDNLGDVHAKIAAQAYDKALNLNSDSGGIKSKLTVLHTLGIPTNTKPAAVFESSTASVASAVSAPAVVTPTVPVTPPASTTAATLDTEKRRAIDKPAVAPAIAGTRNAAGTANANPTPPVSGASAKLAKPQVPASSVAAAPQPTPVGKPIPAPVAISSDQKFILANIDSWSRAWTTKNMDGYVAAYIKDYKGSAKSHAAWVAERRMRIVGKDSINLTIEKPKVTVSGNMATAEFRQVYRSGNVHSDGTKTLSFKKVGEKWKITNEISTD